MGVQVIIFEDETNANEIIEDDRKTDITVENTKIDRVEKITSREEIIEITKSIHDRDTEREKEDETQVTILEKTKEPTKVQLKDHIEFRDFQTESMEETN